jgi:hypothetical protein
MAKLLKKNELRELLERYRGNIPLIGKALDKISPNFSNELGPDEKPLLKPRTYSAVYRLLERHGLLIERHKMDIDLDQEIVATAKMKFLQAVLSGQRWAVERVVQSKLGYGNKETLDQKLEITITKGILTHKVSGKLDTGNPIPPQMKPGPPVQSSPEDLNKPLSPEEFDKAFYEYEGE